MRGASRRAKQRVLRLARGLARLDRLVAGKGQLCVVRADDHVTQVDRGDRVVAQALHLRRCGARAQERGREQTAATRKTERGGGEERIATAKRIDRKRAECGDVLAGKTRTPFGLLLVGVGEFVERDKPVGTHGDDRVAGVRAIKQTPQKLKTFRYFLLLPRRHNSKKKLVKNLKSMASSPSEFSAKTICRTYALDASSAYRNMSAINYRHFYKCDLT